MLDIHSHFLPVEQLSAFRNSPMTALTDGEAVSLKVLGDEFVVPTSLVDPQSHVESAVEHGIDRRVLSVPPFAALYELPSSVGIEWARRANEGLALAAAGYPERLRSFATVPLQAGGDAAARELEFAVSQLGMVGAEILSSVVGRAIDSDRLEPFWATAARLNAPILIHPHFVSGAERMRDFHLRNIIGNPSETALTAAQLIFGGLLARYPSLSIILSHGGGGLISLVGRMQHAYERRPEFCDVSISPRDRKSVV